MDPALWEMLEEETNDEIAAIVRLRQPGLAPEQVRLVAQFGDIATCRLSRQDIPRAHADQAVESLKASRPLEAELGVDLAGSASGFLESPAWNDRRRPPGLEATGRGVVVGLVDWGCDFAHPDFRYDDGTTRLLALWDQRGPAGLGVPNRYGYGTIHSAEAINRALEADDPYAALGYHPASGDPDGYGAHGAHVMGIAAGNGRGGGPPGVAPDCDLVFVHLAAEGTGGLANLGDSVTFLEAVDFVVRSAGERPCVINASVGRRGGPHDGSTLVEQGLDALLVERPGLAMVQSAGNYFNQRAHASGQLFPGEERTMFWWVDSADRTPNELEVWYSGRDTLVTEIRSPDADVLAQVSLGERASLISDGQEVGRIYHRAYDPNNHHHHIDIFLDPGAPGGAWEIALVGEDVVDGRFHAWVERDAGCLHCQSRFDTEDDDPASTTGTICNGFRTIAVGAYNPHSPERELAHFSSSGPTRDGRQKPDCTAPGVQILAPRSAPRDLEVEAPLYTRKSGTSMAAPHVTGCIACMFEAASRPLTIQETRNALLGSTRPVATPAESLARIGSGYLDVAAAVEAARRIGAETRPAESQPFGAAVLGLKLSPWTWEDRSLAETPDMGAEDEPQARKEKPMQADKNEGWPGEFEEESFRGHPLESGKKRNFILISGGPGPYDDRDVEHDSSWANYVTPPLLLTDTPKKLRNFAEEDEEVWWFVYRPAYERRWNEDVKDPRRRKEVDRVRGKKFKSYVDMIQGRAKDRGWNLRWLDEADDLWEKLKTFKDRISRVWYWGHARDDLWLSVRHDEDNGEAIAPESHEIITRDSIKANRSLAGWFQDGDLGRTHRFIGCNTSEFAQVWAKTFGVWAEGVDGFIHFKSLHITGGEPCLVSAAQVKYYSPKGVHDPLQAWRATAQPCKSLSLEALDEELDEEAGPEGGLAETNEIVDGWFDFEEIDSGSYLPGTFEEESEVFMNDRIFEPWFTEMEDMEPPPTGYDVPAIGYEVPPSGYERWEEEELFAGETFETSAAEGYPYLDRPAPSLVELADEAISAGADSYASGALLTHVLADAAVGDMFGSLGINGSPSAALLFDAFAGGSPGLARHFGRFFDVIAYPGGPIPDGLEQGDLLIRRGEGGLAHLAMIAERESFWADELAAAGLQAETFSPGLYVQVVESGPFRHTHEDRFARRLTREGGRLDYDNLLLRLRPGVVDSLTERLWDEGEVAPGLPDIDEESQAAVESVKAPRAIPTSDPVPFAPSPPTGSYWPVVTSHPRGREVNYQAEDRSFVGSRRGRSFLADRSKGTRYHVGVDLFANLGDPVVACEDGKILSFYGFCCGETKTAWAIVVEHADLVINYGEVAPDSLKRAGLSKGSTVKAGQIIGTIGRNPGGSSMLHFETYVKGTTANERWLKGKMRPRALLNPTAYLLALQEHGLTGPRGEEPTGPATPSIPSTPSIPTGFGALTDRIQEALRAGLWAVAIRLAIQSGQRDEVKLANMVFFARHPELGGRRIRPDEKDLAREWLQIRNQLVRPALAQRYTSELFFDELNQEAASDALQEATELAESFVEEGEDEGIEDFLEEWADLEFDEEIDEEAPGLDVDDFLDELEDEEFKEGADAFSEYATSLEEGAYAEEAAFPFEGVVYVEEEPSLDEEIFTRLEEFWRLLSPGTIVQRVQQLLSEGVFNLSLLARFASGQIWNEDYLALEVLFQRQPRLRPDKLDTVSGLKRLRLLRSLAVKHQRKLKPIRERIIRPIFGNPANFQIGPVGECQIRDLREEVRKLGPLKGGTNKQGRIWYKKDEPRSPRKQTAIDSIVLHHMAYNIGNEVNLYKKVGAHYIVTADGQIAQLYNDLDFLNASNGFNSRSVAIEFAGNFPDHRYHWWRDRKSKSPIPDRCYLTPSQIRAGRCLLATLKGRLPGIKYLYAHRQSSKDRANDPGPDVWFNIGEWALTNLNLTDGLPRTHVGTGQPIPKNWRMSRSVITTMTSTPTPDSPAPVPPAPSSTRPDQAIDVEEAVRYNRDASRKLGWSFDQIRRFFGFSQVPDERRLALTVAQWQQSHGLKVDGKIGPNTWARMQAAMGVGRSPQPPVATPGGKSEKEGDNWQDPHASERRVQLDQQPKYMHHDNPTVRQYTNYSPRGDGPKKEVERVTSNGSFVSRVLRIIARDKQFEGLTGLDGLTIGIGDFAAGSDIKFLYEAWRLYPTLFREIFGQHTEVMMQGSPNKGWLTAHQFKRHNKWVNDHGLITIKWLRRGIARLLADRRFYGIQLRFWVDDKVTPSLATFRQYGFELEFTLAAMCGMANSMGRGGMRRLMSEGKKAASGRSGLDREIAIIRYACDKYTHSGGTFRKSEPEHKREKASKQATAVMKHVFDGEPAPGDAQHRAMRILRTNREFPLRQYKKFGGTLGEFALLEGEKAPERPNHNPPAPLPDRLASPSQ